MSLEATIEDRIVSFVESYYWTEGHLPDKDLITTKLDVAPSSVVEVLNRPNVQRKLRARGIESVPNRFGLTPVQQLVASALANNSDRRSERAKLEDINAMLKNLDEPEVTMHMVNGWKRTPAFRDALIDRARHAFTADEYKFWNAVSQGTEERNPQMTKIMGELLGKLGSSQPQVTISVDINALLEAVFTAVSRVVTDHETLARIGEELETIVDVTEAPAPGHSEPTEPAPALASGAQISMDRKSSPPSTSEVNGQANAPLSSKEKPENVESTRESSGTVQASTDQSDDRSVRSPSETERISQF